MPLPGMEGVERTPLAKKGKSRSRRLSVSWVYRDEDSNNDDTLNRTEVKSTNIGSAVTALLRGLNDGVERGDDEFLKKSDIVVVEVRILARGESVE